MFVYFLDFVLTFGGKEVGGGHVTSQCGVLLRQMFCFRGGALVQQPWMRVACRCPRSSPAWVSPPAQRSCPRPIHPCWILGREGRWTQAGEGMYVVFVAEDSDWQTTWGDTSGFTPGRNLTSVHTVPIEPHRNSLLIDIFAQFMQIFSYYKNPQWVLWMLLVHLLAFPLRLTSSLTLDLINLNLGGPTPALKKTNIYMWLKTPVGKMESLPVEFVWKCVRSEAEKDVLCQHEHLGLSGRLWH